MNDLAIPHALLAAILSRYRKLVIHVFDQRFINGLRLVKTDVEQNIINTENISVIVLLVR